MKIRKYIELKDELDDDLAKYCSEFVSYKNNIARFNFVGLLAKDNEYFFIYPKYTKNANIDSNHDDFLEVLNVIEKYHKNNLMANNVEDVEDVNPLNIAILIIKDFYENGIYTNTKDSFSLNDDNEICWEKTIDELETFIVDDTPFYLDYYTHTKIEFDSFINELHKAILDDIFTKYADILKVLQINISNVDGISLDSFEEIDYLIQKLENELKVQFVTAKRYTLKLLIGYLKSLKTSTLNTDYLGTKYFHNIWEDVCRIYLKGRKSSIAQKPEWIIKDMKIIKDTLEPDILVGDASGLEIYDAKYYDLEKNTPSANDIIKQITYKKAYELKGYKVVLNAFVFPNLDCLSFEIVGEVRFLNNSVTISYLNPKLAYKKYL
ncbi:type II restriction endonuclease [Campylobacter sp. RM5004]|uniref:LlaJI family restriction endonuclease n=1 Tax=Campylobacter sp. RM5004 TaxID=1660078 RepID=UPI001EFC1FD4|nr:LlaJI family restriction endonuclease [Campylobacter sp. RM5004]ULO01963.1 type II restriction endonuclease [Campylobacter sp. RM5004]